MLDLVDQLVSRPKALPHAPLQLPRPERKTSCVRAVADSMRSAVWNIARQGLNVVAEARSSRHKNVIDLLMQISELTFASDVRQIGWRSAEPFDKIETFKSRPLL